jgi:hypothetical protein
MNAVHIYPGGEASCDGNAFNTPANSICWLKKHKQTTPSPGKPYIIEEIFPMTFGLDIEQVILGGASGTKPIAGISHNGDQYTPAQFNPGDPTGIWRYMASFGLKLTRYFNPAGLR